MSKSQATAQHGTLPTTRPRIVYESPPLSPEDVTDGAGARHRTFARDTVTAGVCVVDGMGVRITVDRGALVIEDGMGDQRCIFRRLLYTRSD